jgi:hypothetical protein
MAQAKRQHTHQFELQASPEEVFAPLHTPSAIRNRAGTILLNRSDVFCRSEVRIGPVALRLAKTNNFVLKFTSLTKRS